MNVPDLPLRLWHPARASVDEVRGWREAVQGKELRQPFKQAFREIYLLTPAHPRGGGVRLSVQPVQGGGGDHDDLGDDLVVDADLAVGGVQEDEGKAMWSSGRSLNAVISTSRPWQMRETSLLEIPLSAPRALTRSTARVDTPWT